MKPTEIGASHFTPHEYLLIQQNTFVQSYARRTAMCMLYNLNCQNDKDQLPRPIPKFEKDALNNNQTKIQDT
jgi:hypothetical protein